MWRVTGAEGTLYLVGSIHALKPSLFPLPGQTAYQRAGSWPGGEPAFDDDPARMSAPQASRPSEKTLREMPKAPKKT